MSTVRTEQPWPLSACDCQVDRLAPLPFVVPVSQSVLVSHQTAGRPYSADRDLLA